jgi:ureidoglycolate lyase
MRLIATPVTAEAMRPFGALVEPPANAGERAIYTEWLGTTSVTATPRLHINFVPETQLPCRIALLEKHPYGAQIFLPLDVSRYLIVVAPSLASGLPDLADVQAFIAPGTVGMIYRANTWHAGATALDDKGHFAVHMDRNDLDDDVFFDLEEPLEITL